MRVVDVLEEKMSSETNVGYQLYVCTWSWNNKMYCALFKDYKSLAEVSDFNSLEGVLDKLASNLRLNNEHPIPKDAPIKVVNGQYPSGGGYFKIRFKPAEEVPFSDAELTQMYFSAQDREIHSAYLSWKFGI